MHHEIVNQVKTRWIGSVCQWFIVYCVRQVHYVRNFVKLQVQSMVQLQSRVQVKVQSMVQVKVLTTNSKSGVKFSKERTWSDTIIKQATTPPPHHRQTF